LLCLVEATSSGSARLNLSGPLSLFHHTIKYGRAMAAWLPVVIRAPRWSLTATCRFRGERTRWRADYRDPLGTTHAPLRRFDSKLEERLFRDIRRLDQGWQVLREADPVQLGRRIVCPDFTLVDRKRGLRVPVEIVGYWTPRYLQAKLQTFEALPPSARWLVCVDSSLVATEAKTIAAGDGVFRFERRIDAARFLDHVEALVVSSRYHRPP
jgi:predicted nuclease of restriction endonuclease-like RecB superfamily